MFLSILVTTGLFAQNVVKGIVVDSDSKKPLQNVSVSIKNTNISQKTNALGAFTLSNISNGSYIVEIKFGGYETQNFPVQLSGSAVDLGTILLYIDLTEDQDLSTVTITDDELNDDTSAADNISGLLQSARDVYLRTAAFEFSSSFFRIRGLDSENGKVLINGIEMNKLYNGRPQWSNWGGLNDVLRNQEFSNGLTPSDYTFGGVLGATNINTRASEYRAGGRVSYASSNRSYVHRVMATYSSGLMDNGWAFTVSASRRAGNEGFNEGTFYNANSAFVSLEKKINDNHSINFTAITAFNKRGKSAPHTQEVYDLKGIQYNEYWGYQNGKARNSRIRDIQEPILMLNHYWDISDKTSLNTNVSYQFGKIGNSRIDFNGARLVNGNPVGGGSNPSPVYYQKLPSYALRNNTGNAYELQQQFLNNGQLDWDEMIRQNLSNPQSTNSKYILYEDRNDDKQFTVNSILNTEVSENITINGRVQYTRLKSENFANVLDLLGGQGFLDVDTFGATLDQKQNDLRNPNRLVGVGDKFRYNFNLESNVMDAFAQAQFKYNKVDFFLAGTVSRTTHQREGLYENGSFPGAKSFGKSEKLSFTNFGAKGGLTYKITGRHLLDANAGYITKAPSLRNSFSNSRENNNVVNGLTSEKIMTFDASYIFRSPIITSKITGYYTKIKDATEISFFFTDGLAVIQDQTNDDNAFVQEVLSGIDKRHFGVELGIEAQVTPTIKLKGAANIGQYTYDNNPNIYLTSDRFAGELNLGTSNLKDYKVASGPQHAYSVGFEYRDPEYWWVGMTANYFDRTYVDVAPITRTANFYRDTDGLPFSDYDPVVAKRLLQQERFDDYMVVNAVGGKSWKVGDYFIGMFASINNIFDKQYKSGGFEQSRNANYRVLKADKELDKPVFGNRYWYGRGTTYFLNVYFRF